MFKSKAVPAEVGALLQEPLPALEDSDINTDDKNSLSGSPTFEYGGDIVEHDMWSDHSA